MTRDGCRDVRTASGTDVDGLRQGAVRRAAEDGAIGRSRDSPRPRSACGPVLVSAGSESDSSPALRHKLTPARCQNVMRRRSIPFSAIASRLQRLPLHLMLVWCVLLLPAALPPAFQADARAAEPLPASELALAVRRLGNSSAPRPGITWTWGYRMLDPQKPFNPYACTDKPGVHYCGYPCGTKELGMNECNPNLEGDCEACGGNCPMPGESVTQFTGWEGKSFPLRCLRVVEAVEDTWTPLYITVESILTEAEEQGVGMAVTLTNVYGDFDLHGCNTTLKGKLDKSGWFRVPCPNKVFHQARVEYFISPPPAPQRHTITLMGTVAMVREALGVLSYRPPADSNSKRLAAAHLDQVSTQFQPYETLSWNVSVGVCKGDDSGKGNVVHAADDLSKRGVVEEVYPDDEDEKMRGTKKVRWEDGTLSGWLEPKHIASHICTSLAEETEPDEEDPDAAVQSLPTAHVAEFDMIVHIWELNDPPDISDPQKCYFRPGCYGDLRDVRITSGGTKYYTELMTETGPVKVAPTLVAECESAKCQECVTEQFRATVDISATGTVTALHVTQHGRGYVSEFPPRLVFKGGGSGQGAEVRFDIGASLFAPCPFPQSSRGIEGFPDQAQQAENCEPEPECSAGSAFPLPATYPLNVLEYYFGQYWRYEDRAESLSIGGIQIYDIDVTETCTYARPYCTLLDVQARAQQGSLQLNRRQNIAVYMEKRNALAWSSSQENANMAIKVLLYQTELPALLGPESSALNYNSQVLGGRDEFVVVSAQDQGFTGFDGVSACFKGGDHTGLGFGKELSCGLRLNVTIVAVNDPPEIQTPEGTMIKAFENDPFLLDMLHVIDTDVNERTTSLLGRAQCPQLTATPKIILCVHASECNRIVGCRHIDDTHCFLLFILHSRG